MDQVGQPYMRFDEKIAYVFNSSKGTKCLALASISLDLFSFFINSSQYDLPLKVSSR